MKGNHVTLKDIAKKLGITAATVSRALKDYPDISPLTKKAVLEMVKEMKYRPNPIALNLRKNQSNTIGVIIPNIIHNFFSSVISGIMEKADEEGYSVVICQSNENYQREVREAGVLFSSRVDGLLISLSNETKEYEHLKEFLDYQVPVVLMDKICDELEVSKVVVDDFEGAFHAVEHLIKQGCKRIAHIKGPNAPSNVKARYEGYLKALKKHKIPFDPNLVFECQQMSYEDGYEQTSNMLTLPTLPDGIFAGSEMAAVGALVALKENKIKIPEEIAIIGFNDFKMASVIEPSLTTVYQPGEEMGRVAVEILLNEIKLSQKDKPITHRTETLKTHLIERDSSNRRKNSISVK
jgi:LacI family transcriptional regulator